MAGSLTQRNMLKMRSRENLGPMLWRRWQEVKEVDVSAITEYFKLLYDWMKKQRKEIGDAPLGWDEYPTMTSTWLQTEQVKAGPTSGIPFLIPVMFYFNVMVLAFPFAALVW